MAVKLNRGHDQRAASGMACSILVARWSAIRRASGPAPPMTTPRPQGERCASRLSIAMLGKRARRLSCSRRRTRKGARSTMTSDWAFIDRFSRFLNACSTTRPARNVPTRRVISSRRASCGTAKPYRELFTGKAHRRPAQSVVEQQRRGQGRPAGIGYFNLAVLGSLRRQRENGVRLRKAYRILNNTSGSVVAASNAACAPGREARRGTGARTAVRCRSCHFDSWFALDRSAGVLGDD